MYIIQVSVDGGPFRDHIAGWQDPNHCAHLIRTILAKPFHNYRVVDADGKVVWDEFGVAPHPYFAKQSP